ncbi:uncharacterized protein LOC133194600 [Saccostrea echinata]|uniref:uncharacterized protein LOC133194600 n=1 Tax=Saccostrea echinata TaxID=191078 RepID=UPI002A7EFA41|nr:uncharacterized protein LOC133194600 [Saccostrea echinata]
MVKANILYFSSIFVFQLFKVQFIFSQEIYEDISNFEGPFTENLKNTVCRESVKTCGIRLHLYQIMHQLTTERLFELQKAGLKNESTVSLFRDRSRACQLRLKKMEMNVSESLSSIDSLRKLYLNTDLELQELQNKMDKESNKVLTVNESLSICEKEFDECTFSLANTISILTTTNETLRRTIKKLEQTSLELNDERAKVDAINNSLKQCNEVRRDVDANLTRFSEALGKMEKTIFILENESLLCNLTLDGTSSNLTDTSRMLQSSEKAKQKCLNLLEIQNKTNIENVQTILSMNDSLLNCERSLEISRENFSESMLNMSSNEFKLLETIKFQLNETLKLKNQIFGMEAMNESLQNCDLNLQNALKNLSEYNFIISTMKTNWSDAISECSNDSRILKKKLQNCETSLELAKKEFSELESQVQRTNVSFTETLSLLQNKSDELENDLSEYQSTLEKMKSVPKRILSWTVDDLCRNIPNFVFEDSDLCPFFYDCSQTGSYLQQCPYPQLFSDNNYRCEDSSTVRCGSRIKTYGYTCDFESLPESNCFLVDSDSGTFRWTRHSGSTSSSDTGPNSAYRGLYYAYIETSSPRQLGDNAILESNRTFQDTTYCLSLYYHMRGSHIGSLIIKTENSSNKQTVLRQISGEQGNRWQRMDSLDIPLNKETKVLIEATRGSSYEGDISIDLITLWPKKCLT